MQYFLAALRFLTRLPAPVSASVPNISRAAPWFPLIGAILGTLVTAITLLVRTRSELLAAALGVLTWVWLTGALHLDGLADLSDALAASHDKPERFLEVLTDPHVGTFAATSIVLVLLLKTVALSQLSTEALAAVPLVLAWARLGPLAWARWLPPLKDGHGRHFSSELSCGWIFVWSLLLLALSSVFAPWLCAAPLLLAMWGLWLHRRVHGFNGDCLGAGVEVCEVTLLVLLALTTAVQT